MEERTNGRIERRADKRTDRQKASMLEIVMWQDSLSRDGYIIGALIKFYE